MDDDDDDNGAENKRKGATKRSNLKSVVNQVRKYVYVEQICLMSAYRLLHSQIFRTDAPKKLKIIRPILKF